MEEDFNTKKLFSHLCSMMDKLDKKEISVGEANSQANMVGKARQLLEYEIRRSKHTGKDLREL